MNAIDPRRLRPRTSPITPHSAKPRLTALYLKVCIKECILSYGEDLKVTLVPDTDKSDFPKRIIYQGSNSQKRAEIFFDILLRRSKDTESGHGQSKSIQGTKLLPLQWEP